MHVFYLNIAPQQNVTELSEEESKHAVRVLRLKTGDEVMLADGMGCAYTAHLIDDHPKRCKLAISEVTRHAPTTQLHIAICPTKNNERTEWFIEKAVELGISRISFLICERSERTKINMERCIKTAVSAMKQSKQWWLPKLDDAESLTTFCQTHAEQYQHKFIAWCETPNTAALSTLLPPSVSPALVLIGPEGDFTQAETEMATHLGYQPVSLGNSILRTETAGIYVCALMRGK